MINSSQDPDDGQTIETEQKIESIKLKKKSNLFTDVIKLVFGTGTGQVISALSMLVLARLYDPESIGLFGIYVSISGILTIIACLRYELSINLPTSDAEGANQFAICLIACTSQSIILIPTIWLAGGILSRYLNAPDLVPYLWFLPINMLLGGTSLALNYWNSRTLKFGRLSAQVITNMLVTAIAQIALGFKNGAGAGELIIGSLIGTIVGVGFLIVKVWKEDHEFFLNSIRWPIILAGIKRYKKFPLVNVWSAILNNLSWQLPTFMLTHFFSPTISGYYSLGNRVLRVPMSLIGGAIGQAQYPRLARARDNGRLSVVIEKTASRLIAYSVFPLLVISLVGSDLFVVLFGKQWAEAGVYTQILSFWTVFWFISAPLSSVFSVMEKQEKALRINSIIFITRLISLWGGGLLKQPRLAIIFYAVTGVIIYGYYSYAIMRLSGSSVNNVLRNLAKYVSIFIPVGLVIGVFKLFSINSWIQLIFSGISIIIFYGYVIYKDEQMTGVIKRFLVKFTQKKMRTEAGK
jgi:O-antigen/teichoic acid export membrane protein